MTKERLPEDADSVTDSLVTRTYRDVARERAPASLNEAVLRDANAIAGRGYSRSIRWLRPMAWAATIGLCVAIVVDLADMPQVDFDPAGNLPAVSDIAAAEPNSVAEAEAVTEFGQTRDDESEVDKIHRDEEDRQESKIETFEADSDTLTPAAQAIVNEEMPAMASPTAPARDQSDAAELSLQSTVSGSFQDSLEGRAAEISDLPQTGSSEAADAFAVRNMELLDDAEDMAGMREGQVEAPFQAAARLRQNVPGCDDQARLSADTWYACIRELRQSDEAELADDEEALLREAFPNFVWPEEP